MAMSTKVPDIGAFPRSPASSLGLAGRVHYFSGSKTSRPIANRRRPSEPRPENHYAVCHLYQEIVRRRSRTIMDPTGRPARVFGSLHSEPATRRLACRTHPLRRWRILWWDHGAAGTEAFIGRHRS